MGNGTVRFQPSADYDEALRRAADLWGIEADFWDIWGKHHVTPPAAMRTILESLGVPAASAEDLDRAMEDRMFQEWSRLTEATRVVSEQSPPGLPIRLPEAPASGGAVVAVRWEDGTAERHDFTLSELEEAGKAEVRGKRFELRMFRGFLRWPLGYHDVEVEASGARAVTRLIICPDRVWFPPALRDRGRGAGIAISLHGLRSNRNWGCGDFTDLERFIDWVARDIRASFVALNPLHAIHNRQPYNTSPYLPNCIFYKNFIYLDVERVADFPATARAPLLLRRESIQRELSELRQAEFLESERVHRLKLRFLKLLFRTFLQRDYRADSARAVSFRHYVAREGELLDRFAVYSALDEHFHKKDPNVWVWTQWPEEYRDPRSPATLEFARSHWRSVLFFKYVQWQVDLQLAAAQWHARERGLSIGLYHDLALATDRFGSDLWAHGSHFVAGARVGSPPDDFAPEGQDWSFPPPHALRHRESGYRLFAESIRKNSLHGGALRIDHVMRFFRLYWIPDGRKATEGAYVRDFHQDLLHILALESVRGEFAVVGEDLGTVPDFVREQLARFGVLSCRLLYFEKTRDNQFKPADRYPYQALVSSTTHDLPTLAGFWIGRDIEARRSAGKIPDDSSYRRQIADRAAEKQKLLDLLFRHGLMPSWHSRNAADIPELTGELHNGIIGFLASTPSALLVLNEEDLTKEPDQQNLPGTTHQYPNWRRRTGFTIEELLASPRVRDYTAMFRHWLEWSGRIDRH